VVSFALVLLVVARAVWYSLQANGRDMVPEDARSSCVRLIICAAHFSPEPAEIGHVWILYYPESVESDQLSKRYPCVVRSQALKIFRPSFVRVFDRRTHSASATRCLLVTLHHKHSVCRLTYIRNWWFLQHPCAPLAPRLLHAFDGT
jgi:hypothetical protein